ncbi:unnamed protein product, partial [Ranitomeya imitator]
MQHPITPTSTLADVNLSFQLSIPPWTGNSVDLQCGNNCIACLMRQNLRISFLTGSYRNWASATVLHFGRKGGSAWRTPQYPAQMKRHRKTTPSSRTGLVAGVHQGPPNFGSIEPVAEAIISSRAVRDLRVNPVEKGRDTYTSVSPPTA